MSTSPPSLRIDFVSDVVCPWCAIGLASLEEALRRVAGEIDVELHIQPFELNPQLGAALHAHEAGMPVLYLGTELPPAEIARVASRLEAPGVALSSIDPNEAPTALSALRELDGLLPAGVPVWLGGANARYLAEELASPRIRAVIDPEALSRSAAARVRTPPAAGRRRSGASVRR